jgi:3-oxoacyl-[acyl-carrier protein] reductase
LAGLGASVIVHDVNGDGASETVDGVLKGGGKATSLVCDATDKVHFSSEIQRIGAELGGITALVNNVAVLRTVGALEDLSEQYIDQAFRTNVYSFVWAMQAVVPTMKERRAGKVVNTSSSWALVGVANRSLYTATKAAVIGLTKSWALELAPWNINVNCIAPGGVKTHRLHAPPGRLETIPLRRYAEPIDVSHLVEFLISEKSSYMTGTVLTLTGGEHIV